MSRIRVVVKRLVEQQPNTVRQRFEIEASPNVMKAFERFMAHLQYCSSVGHSANVAMSIDGDGADRFKVVSGSDESGAQAEERRFSGYLEMIETGD